MPHHRDAAIRRSPSAGQRIVRLLFTIFAAITALPGFANFARAQDPVTVRVNIRDSISGRQVSDAVIELRANRIKLSERTDGKGYAQFPRVAPGVYNIATLRIGYSPRLVVAVVGTRDTTINIAVVANATELTRFQVRSNTQELFGIVAGMPNLMAVVGAKVEVPDARRETTVDSLGNYSFRDLKAGQYVLRITAPGFSPRIAAVTVPGGKAVESSHLLDVGQAPSNALRTAWIDMDRRVFARAFNSALVSADELHRHGGSLGTALQFSREVAAKGFRIAGPVCVFLNGRPMPNWSLDSFNPEEVAMIEVYGGNGDATSFFQTQWPAGAACGNVAATGGKPSQGGLRTSFVVVWTKQ